MCIGTLSKIALGGIAAAGAAVLLSGATKAGKEAIDQAKIVHSLNKEDDEINDMIDELNKKGFNLG